MTQIISFGFSRTATDSWTSQAAEPSGTNGYAQPIGGFSRSNPKIIGNNAQPKSVKSVKSVVDKN